MVDFFKNVNGMMEKSNQQLTAMFDKVFNVHKPGVVFSDPIQAGDYTLITATEVIGGGMYFSGIGGGIGPNQKKDEDNQSTQAQGTEGQESTQPSGGGAGASGGGWSGARPVATIIVGPNGVQVQPVVDVTKIFLAMFTAMGAMFLMRRRMRRFSRHMRKAME